MSPRVHIVVPVHNRRETTTRFVTGLAAQSMRNFHLVLVDDGSTDGTAAAVRTIWPEVDVVRGPGDWWWAGALEHGCAHLSRHGVGEEDVLLLINDDVEIGRDFLAIALEELGPLRDTLLLARQVDAKTGRELDGGGGVYVDLARLRFTAAASAEQVNCLPTRGLFLRWRDFQRVGGFRADRLPHYLSDYEFTLRAARRGLQLKVASQATVRVNTEQTGRSLANLFRDSRVERFRLLLSPRYKDNPLTWSAFVSLATRPAVRPFLWLKIWVHFLATVVRCLITPIQQNDAR